MQLPNFALRYDLSVRFQTVCTADLVQIRRPGLPRTMNGSLIAVVSCPAVKSVWFRMDNGNERPLGIRRLVHRPTIYKYKQQNGDVYLKRLQLCRSGILQAGRQAIH